MTDASKRVALLVIHTNSYFANLLPVAKLLAASGIWEPRFLFPSWYPTVARDQERCDAEGFAWDADADEPRRAKSSLVRGMLARLRGTLPYVLGQHVATMRKLSALLRRHRVALLVLPADNRYDLAAYVKTAHGARIAAVAIPAFMAAANEWAEFVLEDPAHQLDGFANFIAGTLHPKWVRTHAGKQLIALPAAEVLAREWLGIAPARPWILHSGNVDAIAVESEAMRRYCLFEGIPARQLVLTGSMDHDRMYARLGDAVALREAMYRKLGMPPNRPLLLTALAPDWLYGRGRKDCEFTEYRELVRFWIETLSATGCNVVVSLHPSVKRETMEYLEQWGAKITDENVSSVIPLCDVYIACVSATIQWAIACGKPVINYDVYRFRYPDYLGVEGCLNLETRADYVAAVNRLTQDASYRAELTAKQARDAKYWGVLDGKAGERLLELFTSLSRA
ncbi:MAG TPA: hypothetical protein VIV40_02255 [Kofleriaceae bacterium]